MGISYRTLEENIHQILNIMEFYLLASLLVGLASGLSLPGWGAMESTPDYGGTMESTSDYGGTMEPTSSYGGTMEPASSYGGIMEPTSDYGSEDYGTADVEYGRSGYGEKKCYPTYETKFRDACEDYSEKVCYTTQKESCTDVPGQKCKAIQTSKQERKCFNVNEMLCSLKENVKYEENPAVFTIQKCHKVTERVCDTGYETEYTEKDDFQCITITNPQCGTKEHTVYDKTCRTVTHFDCKATGYADNDGYGSGSSNSYGDSYGSSNTGSYGDSYGSSNTGSYGQDDSYGHKCTRTPETKCYTTPRTVSSQHCEDREERVCEKLTEQVPFAVEKQNCHDEHKKVCELEQRSQPKQIKKYVYTKHCIPVPKTVCDNADQKFLQPNCVATSRKECSYHPEEKCENVPKQHCYKIPYQVKKMECSEDYASQGGYEANSYPKGTVGKDY